MPFLRLTYDQAQSLVMTAQTALPNECCGLLLGQNGVVEHIIPVENISKTPTTHFEMNPITLLRLFKQLETTQQTLIGIFHSHPKTVPIPSQEDVQNAQLNYPQAVHLIISLQHNQAQLKAWSITPEEVNDVEILIGNQPPTWQQNDPLSRAQINAILITAIFAILLLISVSFALLPPAPPLPMPIG